MCLCLKRSLPHHIVLYIGGIKLSVCLSVFQTLPMLEMEQLGASNPGVYVCHHHVDKPSSCTFLRTASERLRYSRLYLVHYGFIQIPLRIITITTTYK